MTILSVTRAKIEEKVAAKRRAIILLTLAVAATFAFSACAETLSDHLRITGSSTMAPLVTAIAQRFQSEHPQVQVEVVAVGSGRGALDARSGRSDIGMVSSELDDAEKELVATPIARDGIAVIVHKDNPVAALSEHQIAEIFTGRITRWNQVGSTDAAIVVGKVENHRGSSELFLHHFHLRYEDVKAQQVLTHNTSRVRFIIDNPNAILYMSVGIAETVALAGRPIRLLPQGDVLATTENVRNGTYRLARNLNLVTRGKPGGLARTFIDYARSRRVSDLVTAHDFAPHTD